MLAATLWAPAIAVADEPEIERDPDIQGQAQVGQRLEAVGARWDVDDDDEDGRVRVDYGWVRCENPALWTCQEIPGASGTGYTVSAADVGRRLRAVLVVTVGSDRAVGVSKATKAVTPAPPAPPTPGPPPVVVPPPVAVPPPGGPSPSPGAPAPTPAPPADPAPGAPGPTPGAPQPAPGAEPPAGGGGGTQGGQRRARLMKPFPTVRLQGYLSRRGVVLRRFAVRTPRNVKIRLRCAGDGCPRTAWKRTVRERGTTRVRSFEGPLRAGTRIEVRVTRRNRIGKHTVIRIRRAAAPARIDRCLFPGSRTPSRCPST